MNASRVLCVCVMRVSFIPLIIGGGVVVSVVRLIYGKIVHTHAQGARARIASFLPSVVLSYRCAFARSRAASQRTPSNMYFVGLGNAREIDVNNADACDDDDNVFPSSS